MEKTMRSFFLRNKHGQIQGCVATELVEKQVLYCYASWNPKDKFDKPICRNMAEGRLLSRSRPRDHQTYHVFSMPMPAEKGGVMPALMRHILQQKNEGITGVPERLRKGAKLWLKHAEQRRLAEEALAKLAEKVQDAEPAPAGKLAS